MATNAAGRTGPPEAPRRSLREWDERVSLLPHPRRLLVALLPRQPHRHCVSLRRFVAEPEGEAGYLDGGGKVPGGVEFVAGLVIVLVAVLLHLRLAVALRL